MPKKTKREKIIAQLRRQQQDSNVSPNKTIYKNEQKSVTIAYNTNSQQTIIPKQIKISTNQYEYVFSDLKRIFTVTMSLFFFEGLLYYLLILKK